VNRSTLLLVAAMVSLANVASGQTAGGGAAAEKAEVRTIEAPDIAALRLAAARNEAWAQFDLGVALACGRGVTRNRAEAAAWFSRAAEQGHTEAQSVLAALAAMAVALQGRRRRGRRVPASAARAGH